MSLARVFKLSTRAAALVGSFVVLVGMLAGSSPVRAQDDNVTFNRDVAPIVYEHCSTCHRPGEAAPFSLLT